MNLEKHNPHWKENFYYQFDTARTILDKLIKNIDNRQIITISGLRRTGKTVLLKQLINFLIKEKTPRENILYYSFDEEQPKIEEIIDEFEKLTNNDRSKSKMYVFFDEIQKLEDWQNQIKYYYDNFTIKFFVSGSSSLFIRKKVKESLAGRSFDFHLATLSFKEFLVFRKKTELIGKARQFQAEIKREFEVYLKRQFVETINESEEYIAAYARSILEKVVYIDIPKVFALDAHDLLLRLLRIIASNPGMIIEYEGMSKELGINRTTLSNYLFYLEEAFLIKKAYNFSRNLTTSEKKSKKYYLSCTSFFPYLCPDTHESRIVENLIAIESNARFFWRSPFKDEIDFVLEGYGGAGICPVEVKYSNNATVKDARAIVKFCRKYKASLGIVLTKELEDTAYVDGIKILFIPIRKFLLERQQMGG